MKSLFPILFFCIAFTGSAQNLVPNYSFEVYDTCPSFDGAVRYAIGWNINGINNTPDYYNSCSANFSTPQNSAGYQIPFEGQAYCGFYTYWFPNPAYREYLGTQLETPLNIGIKYFVSFYISLSNYVCGTNKIGILFSTNPYYFNGLNPTYINMAQIFTQNIIIDTLNWVKISGSFIADSSYKYISIGNFFDNANTDTIIWIGTSCVAYYYLDDICISTDSLVCNPVSVDDNKFSLLNISVFPNPVEDFVYFKGIQDQTNCRVFNLQSKLIKDIGFVKNNVPYSVSDLSSGVYFFQFIEGNIFSYKKIVINNR